MSEPAPQQQDTVAAASMEREEGHSMHEPLTAGDGGERGSGGEGETGRAMAPPPARPAMPPPPPRFSEPPQKARTREPSDSQHRPTAEQGEALFEHACMGRMHAIMHSLVHAMMEQHSNAEMHLCACRALTAFHA